MREKNPNPGARARFTTHEEVTTSRELTYRWPVAQLPAGWPPDATEPVWVYVERLEGTIISPPVARSSLAGSSAVNVAPESPVREPFTWVPDHVSHTAEPSDAVVRWARG